MPGSCLQQVAEAARAVEQRGDQEQRPLVADRVERVVQRRGVGWWSRVGRRHGVMAAALTGMLMYSHLQVASKEYRAWLYLLR